MSAYSHGGAVFADAAVQNDVEVVVAGVEAPASDADDREDVHLHSDDGQLREQAKVKVNADARSALLAAGQQALVEKAACMPSGMGRAKQIKNKNASDISFLSRDNVPRGDPVAMALAAHIYLLTSLM